MATNDVLRRLRGLKVFEGFSDEEITTLASAGKVHASGGHQAVLKEGKEAHALCILLAGRVHVSKVGEHGAVRDLATLEAGAVIGEVGLLNGGTRTATVRADGDIQYFVLPGPAFDALLDAHDPAACKLLRKLARILANRQQDMNERIVELMRETEADDSVVMLDSAEMRKRLARAVNVTA